MLKACWLWFVISKKYVELTRPKIESCDPIFFTSALMSFYSETTWAVGIAQLTHHEVQGGGKNPETGGRGIFAPTANRVVS